MIPELGHFALILALALACVQAIVPLLGAQLRNPVWMSYGQPMAWGQFVFLSFAFLCLIYAFITDDFSVAYVAANSNSQLPVQYKFSAVWGGHEGSLLLWIWILGAWSFAVSIFSASLPRDMLARVLAVMGMISVGFLLFILRTSNPFDRHLPEFPQDGGDLNPLLQDFGLIVHPPMLYMGYVGFSVAFAFAIAALISGRLDAAWARWSRPWTNVAWAFLTLGIALGSWWAYYELGWGGWWFWDPVENASFMPWLVGTALVHSLAVTEKRGVFKSWTVLLAIFAFSLSLLGTFLVRSGVLTSVHAFAADPGRGVFILALLAISIGGSLILYALRAPNVRSDIGFSMLSRDALMLLNNIVLAVVTVTVLLGTLYPLVLDALGLGKISVGPPYFNSVFVPLMSLLAIFIGIGPLARWKQTPASLLYRKLWLAALASLLLGATFPWLYDGEFNGYAMLGAMLAAWITLTTLRDLVDKVRHKTSVWGGLRSLTRSYYAMVLGHLGVAVCIMGISLVSTYTEERDVRLEPGDVVEFRNYSFRFDGVRQVRGSNYISEQGLIYAYQGERQVAVLRPEKRLYSVRGQVMTEAAIDPGLFRDLYVALGEPLGDGAWAVRLHYKPFVRWLWLGGLFMTAGGILGALDKRYRLKRKAPATTENVATVRSAGV